MTEPAFCDRTLHFIGIGGAGMSALALIASELGARVTGSDREESAYCARLRAAGIEPAIGHDPAHLPPCAEIVVSTAIAGDNPELVAARERSLTILHRGDLLAEVSQLKRCIAISGTHGKTTTAGMTTQALMAAGKRPSYVVGGELRFTHANAGWDTGEWVVIEADESDRSFLKLDAEVCVITSIELDHHATYPSLLGLEQAFSQFAASAVTRICAEEVSLPGSWVTYGGPRADLAAEAVALRPGGSRFRVRGIDVELPAPGYHNVKNALGALAACEAAGCELAACAPGLAGFQGAARRFESRGHTDSGALVFDDYAHHPTEVRASLEAARTLGSQRVIACFQPHLYSRTARLSRQFGAALATADVVVVCEIYPAREHSADFPGVSGWLVAEAAADRAAGRAVYWAPRLEDAEGLLAQLAHEGDVVLTIGAGDVYRIADHLAAQPGANH